MEIKDKLNSIDTQQADFQYNLDKISAEIGDNSQEDVSLLVKIISIIGSIFATAALYGFLNLLGIFDTHLSMLVSGIISLTLSIIIIRRADAIMTETLAVTTFLIGLILVAMGLDSLYFNNNLVSIIVILMAMITIPIQNNYLISWISLLVICFNFYFLVLYNNWPASYHFLNALMLFAFLYVCIKEASIISKRNIFSKKYFPIRSALLLSVFIGYSLNSLTGFYQEMNYLPFSGLAPIIFSYYLVYLIIELEFRSNIKIKALIFTIVTLLVFPMLMSPGLGISICLFLLCFKIGYRWGIILSIAGFIYFLGQFYYDLNYTLLTKSFILILTGLILIPIQIIFSRMKKYGIQSIN